MNNIDNSGLKPCPFDGGPATAHWIDDDSFTKTVVVECLDCTARVTSCEVLKPGLGREEFLQRCKVTAEDAWNRRA